MIQMKTIPATEEEIKKHKADTEEVIKMVRNQATEENHDALFDSHIISSFNATLKSLYNDPRWGTPFNPDIKSSFQFQLDLRFGTASQTIARYVLYRWNNQEYENGSQGQAYNYAQIPAFRPISLPILG